MQLIKFEVYNKDIHSGYFFSSLNPQNGAATF